MSARDHLRLGPDGKYVWVDDPDGTPEGEDMPTEGLEPVANEDDAIHDNRSEFLKQNLSTISSSLSGPGIGEDVAAKRANLVNAQGKPQVGRREPPEPYDPKPTRIMYAKGLLAGLVVVLVVIAIIVFLGMDYSIA